MKKYGTKMEDCKMADVILFKGAVTYPITIDPSVWIFDNRKIDLGTYNGQEETAANETTDYLKGAGAQWDKELREGAVPPSERRSMVEERKALDGDYAMRLSLFIDNAQPQPGVTHLRIHREDGESVTLPITEAKRAILQFAKNGKPIRERGPVYFYLPEMWQAKEQPIDNITAFEFLIEP
jgi:hypothetical protein